MPINDIFSKRQKRLGAIEDDVYVYDLIPHELRVQIFQIITDTIGLQGDAAVAIYKRMNKILCREYGVFSLTPDDDIKEAQSLFSCFMVEEDIERCLDIVELCFQFIDREIRKDPFLYANYQSADDAIEELNFRFRESSVGFQYLSGELIRVDSQLLHSEVVKPVLNLLSSEDRYQGANDEFLSAFEHYRHARYKESMNECLKSFESVMKAIHEKHLWSYGKGDPAQKLINSCLKNQLIPDYLQTQFSSIKGLLESGTPTVRNKESGHGQGAEIKSIPEHFASYALHLTATNLLFLINCEKKLTP